MQNFFILIILFSSLGQAYEEDCSMGFSYPKDLTGDSSARSMPNASRMQKHFTIPGYLLKSSSGEDAKIKISNGIKSCVAEVHVLRSFQEGEPGYSNRAELWRIDNCLDLTSEKMENVFFHTPGNLFIPQPIPTSEENLTEKDQKDLVLLAKKEKIFSSIQLFAGGDFENWTELPIRWQRTVKSDLIPKVRIHYFLVTVNAHNPEYVGPQVLEVPVIAFEGSPGQLTLFGNDLITRDDLYCYKEYKDMQGKDMPMEDRKIDNFYQLDNKKTWSLFSIPKAGRDQSIDYFYVSPEGKVEKLGR